MSQKITLILSLLLSLNAFSKATTQEGFLLHQFDKKVIKLLKSNPEISFDHPTKKTIEVYGPQGLGNYLSTLGISHLPLKLSEKSVAGYPAPEEIDEKLFALTKKYPTITRLEKIGTSIEGRPIYVVKISDNPDSDELEPEVKYIANMHGDEIVGRELMVLLIEEICSKYENEDALVKKLVDSTEIFIIASMNPDGAINRRRGNSDWVDLNRDFPDFSTSDNQNTPDGREIETKSIMAWQKLRNISLSANFHGGAEVVNYPWDTVGDQHPLHDHIIKISQEYAELVPGMRNSTEFPGGIVNGYEWYEVNGGMQDWSYYWHNDLQVTIELSNTKWPRYSEVERYWNENKIALIEFLTKVHEGMGFKTDDRIKLVSIKNNDTLIGLFEVKNNQFHKVLPSGKYTFEFMDENKNIIQTLNKLVDKSISNAPFIMVK